MTRINSAAYRRRHKAYGDALFDACGRVVREQVRKARLAEYNRVFDETCKRMGEMTLRAQEDAEARADKARNE